MRGDDERALYACWDDIALVVIAEMRKGQGDPLKAVRF